MSRFESVGASARALVQGASDQQDGMSVLVVGAVMLVFILASCAIWVIRTKRVEDELAAQLKKTRAEAALAAAAAKEAAEPEFLATDEQMHALAGKLEGRWVPSKVVGVTFRNEDGSRRQELIEELCEGDQLGIVPEPDNPHDADAIAVTNAYGEQIGYLNQRLAKDVKKSCLDGCTWICFLRKKTGGDGYHWGANIALVEYEAKK